MSPAVALVLGMYLGSGATILSLALSRASRDEMPHDIERDCWCGRTHA